MTTPRFSPTERQLIHLQARLDRLRVSLNKRSRYMLARACAYRDADNMNYYYEAVGCGNEAKRIGNILKDMLEPKR